MHEGQYVFSQLMQWLPRRAFDRFVRQYQGDHRVRRLTCREQLLCLVFAQLTGRDSLRDMVTCLRALQPRLYHMGIRHQISRSTLADANAARDWRIWSQLAGALITRARALYRDDDFGLTLERSAYVLDATVVELCLTLFPWAHAQRESGGVKVHTLMDLRGNIPCFLRISSAKVRDAPILEHLILEPGAYYIMDRAYNDYARLYHVHQCQAFFVVRAKHNLTTRVRASRPVDRTTGLRADQTVMLSHRKTRSKYPEPLRRITCFDAAQHRRFVFITNDFQLPALTVSELYRRRWRIELFFKWIKQHLRIRHFYGTTPNAVHTQLWIAVCTYVLIAIVRKELGIARPMAEMLEIISVTLFEKTPLFQLFHDPTPTTQPPAAHNQLSLFNF